MSSGARRRPRHRYDGGVSVRAFRSRVAVAALATGVCGCAAPPGGLDSPVPAERLRAVGRAVKDRDQSAVPKLITMLGSDDPVVRLAAIRALESLTGQTLGYDHAAAEARREEAIAAWVEWYNRGGLGENTVGTTGKGVGEAVGPAGGNADTVR